MKDYYPLFVVESYLIFTLLIFFLGPVNFNIHNLELFWMLIVLYHFSFILGYLIFTKTFHYNKIVYKNKLNDKLFYIICILAFIGVINAYKNLMMSSTFIPYNIFDEVVKGILEPGLSYSERMSNISSLNNESDSRIFNIVSIFFSFNKLLFIFIFIYFWSDLSKFKKIIAVLYSLLFLSSGVASGTNSVVFIFFIFFSFSYLVITYIENPKIVKRIFIIFIILFLIPLGSFGYIMSQRGGGFEYFSSTSPLGDISISLDTPLLDSFFGFYTYAIVWLNYYLVQGYYGFSLILDLDWNWTYGFGNSEFLQRQFMMLFGIDISMDTFQHRITNVWDKSVQWHSFYGQFANDFGVIGLSILMFMLGAFLSRVWLSVIYSNNLYGMALLPIFMLMFIFFPANNQIFGYIDTFSYFIFISVFWFFKGRI